MMCFSGPPNSYLHWPQGPGPFKIGQTSFFQLLTSMFDNKMFTCCLIHPTHWQVQYLPDHQCNLCHLSVVIMLWPLMHLTNLPQCLCEKAQSSFELSNCKYEDSRWLSLPSVSACKQQWVKFQLEHGKCKQKETFHCCRNDISQN